MKPTLIFDFDGTIADTYSIAKKYFKDFAAEFGLPLIDSAEFDQLKDLDLLEIITKYKVNVFKIPFLIKRGHEIVKNEINSIPLFDGIAESLKVLHDRGYQMGIISGNSEQNVRNILERFGLNIFIFISGKANIFGKQRIINNSIKKYGLNKSEVIYIGDSIRDIVSAKKSGVKVAAVSWGFNKESALVKYSPDYILTNPKQLQENFT